MAPNGTSNVRWLSTTPSHIPRSQFQQEIVQEIIQNLSLHRSSCLNRQGRLVCPSSVYWQSSNLLRSFGTSPISLTLSLYTECDARSVVICKGVGSKQHTPLTRPFQGNHVRTNECVWHGQNEAGPGWDGTSTGSQSRDWEWNKWHPGSTKQERLGHALTVFTIWR